jgi:hypothetical protein
MSHAAPDARQQDGATHGVGSGLWFASVLLGEDRKAAEQTIRQHHYSHSVPSGKSHYVQCGEAIVVWSIPANKNLAKFVLGREGNVWELSRLWAPDGHAKNLLTQAISAAVGVIKRLEKPDALVSYADPNVGHHGGIYRAASWVYHGQSEEARYYRDAIGNTVSRRAFHSGRKCMKKAEILALGYVEHKLPGKHRYVKPITTRAKRALLANAQVQRRPAPEHSTTCDDHGRSL